MRLGEIHRKIKHVPIGPSFQANVPDWTGSSSKKLETDDNKALSDSRWLDSDGWVKMSNNVDGIEIHFLYNNITGAFDDFKFK